VARLAVDFAAGGDRVPAMACPLMFVVDWLSRVPATFWGVLAGSFFSLGGVLLSNRNSARNLRIQLDHDRKTRAIEREMALRKDVYLVAAEAIAAGMLALGRIANVNMQREALDDFNKIAPAIAKVYVIGRIETIDAVVTVQAELTSGFLRLSGYLMPVTILKNRVAVLSSVDGDPNPRDSGERRGLITGAPVGDFR
jgi:hypothetical protein